VSSSGFWLNQPWWRIADGGDTFGKWGHLLTGYWGEIQQGIIFPQANFGQRFDGSMIRN